MVLGVKAELNVTSKDMKIGIKTRIADLSYYRYWVKTYIDRKVYQSTQSNQAFITYRVFYVVQ